MKTAEDPEGRWVKGTLGNCAGGTTPWGTVLSGEENFNGYFAWAADTAGQKRYRATPSAKSTYTFERIDPRFDAHDAGYVNEPNRFGWIVEIDPEDPTSTPRKHTAMGRFKHEGANVIIAEDGHAVAYMGDDQSDRLPLQVRLEGHVDPGHARGARATTSTLLSEGDLYVAKFTGNSPAAEITGTGALPADGAFDGTGQWIPLTQDGESVVPGMTTEEVLVFTRLAADKVGATKMDRPEDVEPNPKTGKVYVALTNNSTAARPSRRSTRPNPRHRQPQRPRHRAAPRRTGQSGDRRSPGASCCSAATRPSTQNTYFAGFPKELGLADLVPRQRRVRLRGQPLDLDRRRAQHDRLQRRALQGAARGPRARPRAAVPLGAARGRDLRSGHPRPGGHGLRRRAAPGRERHGRRAELVLPRLRAAAPPDTGSSAAPRPSVVQVWRA